MKRHKILAGLFLLVGVLFLGFAGIAGAHSIHTGDNVSLGQGGVIKETVFAAGRTIDISNEVYGDIFCAGQNITVSGTVHGDVICAGQNVNITGTIEGDVRLAGQTILIGADVTGNATVAGQTLTLDSGGSIAGDLTIGASDATINGRIGRDIALGGQDIIISGSVGRNIIGTVEDLTLTPEAKVNGSIDYTSNRELTKADKATVTGKITRTEPKNQPKSKHGALFGFSIAWFIYWFLAMLFTALAIALLFPRMLKDITDKAIPKPWKALLVGFLATIAAPIVITLFAVTVIGLPLAIILGLLWLTVLILSGPLFGYYVGRLVLPDSNNTFLIMLAGASLLLVMYFIPIIGLFAWIVATWVGAGMLLLEIFKRTPKPEYTLVERRSSNRKK